MLRKVTTSTTTTTSGSANQNNPTGLPGVQGIDPEEIDRKAKAEGAIAGGATIAGGFPTTYTPQGLQPGLDTSILTFAPGMAPPGAVGDPSETQFTQFGTIANEEPYTNQDAWGIAPSNVIPIQKALIAAGLLSDKRVRFGLWDEVSASAYLNVLGFANAYGLRAQDALRVLVDNPQQEAVRQAPTIAFTNPADVETGFQQISQNMTGTEMPAADFQSYYRGLEEAQAHESGSNYTQAPSVQGAATQYLIDKNPDDVRAYGVASRMNEFFSMLRTPAGG